MGGVMIDLKKNLNGQCGSAAGVHLGIYNLLWDKIRQTISI